MTSLAFALLATAPLIAFDGPEPRDITTNKPTAQQCAAAAQDGRNLLGCNQPGAMVPASSRSTPPLRPQPPAERPREPR